MNFICYYNEIELPLLNDNYKIISDREIFGYLYKQDNNEYCFAICVDNEVYSVFSCKEDETCDEYLICKAHEVTRFYRETKGIQSRHLSASTIRSIETSCHLYNIRNVDIDDTELKYTININLEKTHSRSNDNEGWHIFLNSMPLLSLNSETEIDRILRIIKSDLKAYIIQRWRRCIIQ